MIGTGIAHIAQAVAVGIRLIGVRYRRTTIFSVDVPVTVCILVDDPVAVVVGIWWKRTLRGASVDSWVSFVAVGSSHVAIFIDVDDTNVITDIAIGGQGCSISQASASMMSAAIKGTSVDEARQFISAFKGLMSIHEGELGGDGSEAEMGIDADVADAGDIRLGDLEALKGVVKFPVRIKCATLSWNTLAQALDEAASDT